MEAYTKINTSIQPQVPKGKPWRLRTHLEHELVRLDPEALELFQPTNVSRAKGYQLLGTLSSKPLANLTYLQALLQYQKALPMIWRAYLIHFPGTTFIDESRRDVLVPHCWFNHDKQRFDVGYTSINDYWYADRIAYHKSDELR